MKRGIFLLFLLLAGCAKHHDLYHEGRWRHALPPEYWAPNKFDALRSFVNDPAYKKLKDVKIYRNHDGVLFFKHENKIILVCFPDYEQESE